MRCLPAHPSVPRAVLSTLSSLALVTVVACSSSGGSGGPVGLPELASIVSISVEPGPGPLVSTVVVQLSEPAPIELEYETEDGPRLRISRDAAATHRIPATRLLPDATYTFDARVVGSNGRRGTPSSGTFTTAALPAELASVDFLTTGSPTVPLVLLEVRGPDVFQAMVVVDGRGRVVWFHRLLGPPQGMTRRANGNFVFLDRLEGLLEVTPAGEEVARLDQRGDDSDFHHDIQATPRGTVLALANETRSTEIGAITGEQILEWTPESDALRQVWSAFDFLSPTEDVGPRFQMDDWLHANSIRFGPRDNLLVSFHFLDQVISLAPGLGSIEWRLGGPGSTFDLGPGVAFSGQHTATEVSPDRVLLFDNRFAAEGADRVSRAMEIVLDRDEDTATLGFEFEPPNGNWSRVISSAYRLDGGNTLVGFGATSTNPREVYEVTPGGAIAWRLQIEGITSFFRANPIESLGGESVVSP